METLAEEQGQQLMCRGKPCFEWTHSVDIEGADDEQRLTIANEPKENGTED